MERVSVGRPLDETVDSVEGKVPRAARGGEFLADHVQARACEMSGQPELLLLDLLGLGENAEKGVQRLEQLQLSMVSISCRDRCIEPRSDRGDKPSPRFSFQKHREGERTVYRDKCSNWKKLLWTRWPTATLADESLCLPADACQAILQDGGSDIHSYRAVIAHELGFDVAVTGLAAMALEVRVTQHTAHGGATVRSPLGREKGHQGVPERMAFGPEQTDGRHEGHAEGSKAGVWLAAKDSESADASKSFSESIVAILTLRLCWISGSLGNKMLHETEEISTAGRVLAVYDFHVSQKRLIQWSLKTQREDEALRPRARNASPFFRVRSRAKDECPESREMRIRDSSFFQRPMLYIWELVRDLMRFRGTEVVSQLAVCCGPYTNGWVLVSGRMLDSDHDKRPEKAAKPPVQSSRTAAAKAGPAPYASAAKRQNNQLRHTVKSYSRALHDVAENAVCCAVYPDDADYLRQMHTDLCTLNKWVQNRLACLPPARGGLGLLPTDTIPITALPPPSPSVMPRAAVPPPQKTPSPQPSAHNDDSPLAKNAHRSRLSKTPPAVPTTKPTAPTATMTPSPSSTQPSLPASVPLLPPTPYNAPHLEKPRATPTAFSSCALSVLARSRTEFSRPPLIPHYARCPSWFVYQTVPPHLSSFTRVPLYRVLTVVQPDIVPAPAVMWRHQCRARALNLQRHSPHLRLPPSETRRGFDAFHVSVALRDAQSSHLSAAWGSSPVYTWSESF
ncbi:hypothetical protein AURDEDRAFT_127624 [Auricularia subglabra TFB-10046 SS5]|nr:hypothetical protein AURDEDRAFT_127624 [Auricularia subglabra TFB-10046 SS5]